MKISKYPSSRIRWLSRHWLISLYLLSLVLVVAGTTLVPAAFQRWELLLTAVGGLASSYYFIQRQQLEELRLFKELFEQFNERYDKLNARLYEIADLDWNSDELPELEINATLYDYFNLCAEEYFYYQKRYIYPEVWEAWRKGMKFFYDRTWIGNFWKEELKSNDSYYGFSASILED